jgi:hypothetical protein
MRKRYHRTQSDELVKAFVMQANWADAMYQDGFYGERSLRARLVREAELLLDALREEETRDC